MGVFLLVFIASCKDSAQELNNTKLNKPNIIIIVTDDAGYSDYSFMGSKISTPNIDKLSESSFVFPNFYNNGRCSPTRASLLTGHYPQKVGVGELSRPSTETTLPGYLGFLSLAYTTLAEILQNRGYHTIMSGKWHLGGQKTGRINEESKWPLQRGFDSFYGILGGTVRSHFQPSLGDRYMYNNEMVPVDIYDSDYYSTDALTDHILESLDENFSEERKPFFAYMPLFAPHLPLEAPEILVDKYRKIYSIYDDLLDLKRSRLEGLKSEGLVDSDVLPNLELYSSSKRLSHESKVTAMATHAAMIENVDNNIGRLISQLKRSGQYQNTIIILFSDNGVSANGISDIFNSPFYGRKGMLWEGGIKAPLIVSWPELNDRKRIVKQAWHVMDVMPTILDITGREDKSLTGRSFKSVLEEKKPSSEYYIDRDFIFWSDRKLSAGINKDGMKWIRVDSLGNFLYDLRVDPTELNNLKEEQPAIVQEFRRRFNIHRKENNVESFNVVQNSRLVN